MKTNTIPSVGHDHLGADPAPPPERDHHAGPDHSGADPADPHWRRWLALSMGLFALVPLLDGHVATGGGLLALFSGLLVLRLVVDAEAHGQVGPPR